MKKITFKIITFVGLFLTLSTASASLIPVPNFSFESPTAPSSTITGWSSAGNAGVDPFSFGFPSGDPDGVQHLFLQLTSFGGISPNSATTNSGLIGNAAAGLYTLTVAGGRRDNNATTDGTYLIELLSGTTVIASQLVIDPLNSWAAGTWNDITASVSLGLSDVNLGGDLAVRLSATRGQNNATQAQFDNVRLDFVAVPAPSTFVLLALGLVGLIVTRRNKAL